MVKSRDGLDIDCMFFPCTQNEEIKLWPLQAKTPKSQVDEELIVQSEASFLTKPTVIMCNPNAFSYQQMVVAPNAYWLNFFLKRDINVVCWNYRGYGKSQAGGSQWLTPSIAKMDAENVLHASVMQLRLAGKIGVYGRSIGGIAATHLAAKYSDLVELLIVDRSLSELTGLVEERLGGYLPTRQFNKFAKGWHCKNAPNFCKSTAYKIIVCDPLDDTVPHFESTMSGVARHLTQNNELLDSDENKKFFESLCYLAELEEELYRKAESADLEVLKAEALKSAKSVEDRQKLSGFNNEDGAGDFDLMSLKKVDLLAGDTGGSFFRVLHPLMITVLELSAATTKLRDVLGILKEPKFQDFCLFLKHAAVYGSGYLDDVDYQRFNHRNSQTHSQ